MDDLVARTVRGRAAKQERSERTRGAIVSAVVAVLADQGVGGLTHRLVAQRSGASLAATTYYFASKQDMIAEAANALLRDYLETISRMADLVQGGGAPRLRRFVARIAADAMADEHRPRTLAWCEILLDGARRPESHALTRDWFERLAQIWERIAHAFGVPDATLAARSGMDITVGALFYGLALGMDREQLWATLGGEFAPAQLFAPAHPAAAVRTDARGGAKAAATRERILEAAIRLLAARGARAVNYRSVAHEAGLTPGAPAYHFASSDALLAEAQVLLFTRSKARYREVMSSAFKSLDQTTLVDLSGAIFQSEAGEFSLVNLATYAIWLQAAREPELRPLVQEELAAFYRAWTRILVKLGADALPAQALLVQYRFVGAHVRAMAAGVTASDLEQIRGRLTEDLAALVAGRHWILGAAG